MKIKYLYGFAVASVFLFVTAFSTMPENPTDVITKSAKKVPQWSYEGKTGPSNWGKLDPSFAKCAIGKGQSPINIELSKTKVDSKDIKINYRPTAFTLSNTGHTIQGNDVSGSNTIIIDGVTYRLLQMHFHTPGEHQVNGKSFEMEGHLVHEDTNGKLAVLGFFIQAGNENQVLADMWSKLPVKETAANITLDKQVELGNLLPLEKDFFRYNGSLTTPPCTEGVTWLVLEQPIEMSKAQIEQFRSIFPHNNRPVQQINERQILKLKQPKKGTY